MTIADPGAGHAALAGLVTGALLASIAWSRRAPAVACRGRRPGAESCDDALRASNERLGRTLDAACVLAWDWTPATGQVFLSDNAEHILGTALSGPEGAMALIHPYDTGRVKAVFEHVASEGGPYVTQFRIVRPDDGRVRWLEARGSATLDEAAALVHINGVLTDVTEGKATEKALRDSEERFRAMAETVPGIVFTARSDGSCDYLNQAFQGCLGLAPEGGLGLGWMAALHPEDSAHNCQRWREAVTSGQGFRNECRFRVADGSYRWFRVQSNPVPDASGQVAKWVGTCTDIDDLKRADEKLQLAASAMENAVEGVLVADARNRVVSVNKAFTTITGYTPEEIIGRSSRVLLASREDAASNRRRRRVLKEKERWQGEVWNRRKNGEIYPASVSMGAVRQDGQITHFVSVFSDISAHKRAEARLEYLAHHDTLTGLPNRTLFQERLREMISRAEDDGLLVGLLFIDLDRFKHINDSLGHDAGDQLLRTAAERISGSVRENDLVARLGGDEFTVLLEGLRSPDETEQAAKHLLEVLSRPFAIGSQKLFVSASIGISCFPRDGASVEELLKNADAAMYRAKEDGRNAYRLFSADMNAHAAEKLFLTNSLRLAVSRDELRLAYQPRIDLYSGRIVGLEALVRWHHPEHGIILPAHFIALAEESGLIEPIGEWVLKSACTQLRAWMDAGLDPGRVAVNLSLRQFNQPDLSKRIREILDEAGVDPNALELEITESMVMQDPERTDRVLAELDAIGIPLAVDDFGTGYSSLAYLKRFPISYLKVDRSFVHGLPEDSDDAAITRAILAMAKSLRLRVIAEGVETDAQRRYLREEGCDEGQGYLFSRPLPVHEAEALLARQGVGAAVRPGLFGVAVPA